MHRFYRNIILLALINVGIFFAILFAIHIFFVRKHWQADPDVFIIPHNQTYPFVMLGTSHGQSFTRFANQHVVEKILGERFFNLSQPNAGPVMEKIYLQYFLQQENSTHTLVYFIDPQVFYTDQDNEHYNVLPLYGEVNFPIELLLLQNHITFETQLSYVKTYLSLKWFIKSPRPNLPDLGTDLSSTPFDANRIQELYPNGLDQKTFSHYKQVLNEILKISQVHHMKLIFILPTTRIKSYPGMNQLKQLLETYKKEQGIQYYDLSHAITDPKLYSNLDHLNSAGVDIFTKKYLRQILELQTKSNEYRLDQNPL